MHNRGTGLTMSRLNKDFMTTREAAEQLGVALSTIQHWSEKGLLKAWKTGGGHRRIARSSVEALLRQQLELLEAPEEAVPTVLVVDDDLQALKLFQEHFSAHGPALDLKTASNGFEGLVNMGRFRPDVLITDLLMPGMDGFQMIRTLKRLPAFSDLLIIVVSAIPKAEICEKGISEREMKVFSKPVPYREIGEIILEHVKYNKNKDRLERRKMTG